MSAELPDAKASGAELAQWLDRRTEPAPPTLRDRLMRAVTATEAAGRGSLAAVALSAGESLLDRLLAEGCSTRLAAPDLLAADALVTYAFEALVEIPSETARAIEASATDAMVRIGRLGATA
ncbi:MAG: hypothetical protein ACJ79K_02075 [Gemmatimonadaceae bacterium]